MSLRGLARLFDRIQPAARSTQAVGSHQAALLSPQFDSTEPLNWRWSLNNWLQSWQESSWLAVPKKKVGLLRFYTGSGDMHQRPLTFPSCCRYPHTGEACETLASIKDTFLWWLGASALSVLLVVVSCAIHAR